MNGASMPAPNRRRSGGKSPSSPTPLATSMFLCSISLKAIYGADDQTVYRYLVVGWLLWIVLTASYYLLLIFRTGGKRRLMPRERFVALFCTFLVVFWGFMLLGLKVSLSNP